MNYSVLYVINEEKSTDTIERLKASNVDLDGKNSTHLVTVLSAKYLPRILLVERDLYNL